MRQNLIPGWLVLTGSVLACSVLGLWGFILWMNKGTVIPDLPTLPTDATLEPQPNGTLNAACPKCGQLLGNFESEFAVHYALKAHKC